ncbi:MAG: hypothetical protein ACI4MK_06215, partial [Aristaeellaceae bacterium]
SMAEYYLPEGAWTNVLTGEARQGNRWYREKHGYLSIPLYARENSILVMGAREDGVEYDYAQDAEYRVYGLQEGCTASTCVYGMDNTLSAQMQVQRLPQGYRIAYTGQKPCRVVIMNVSAPISVALEHTGEVMFHED